MAQGDITKQIEYDKIEVVNKWTIQVRQATLIMEEQADGSKKEINRTFHRHTLKPFLSLFKKRDDGTGLPELDSDGKKQWTHTATDISGEDAMVQAIANAAWTDSVKAEYKTWAEANINDSF